MKPSSDKQNNDIEALASAEHDAINLNIPGCAWRGCNITVDKTLDYDQAAQLYQQLGESLDYLASLDQRIELPADADAPVLARIADGATHVDVRLSR